MRQKLQKILLIDDSEADNFIHQRILKKADVTESVIVKRSGEDALNFLKTAGVDGNKTAPELIFLDINMPGMNGWEFLEHYENLELEEKTGIVVCLLTTSTADADKDKAKVQPKIRTYLHKPLTVELVTAIFHELFPDRL